MERPNNDILALLALAEAMKKAAAKAEEQKPENDNTREAAKELGLKLKEAQLGFMDAGFTGPEAFTLVIETLKGEL